MLHRCAAELDAAVWVITAAIVPYAQLWYIYFVAASTLFLEEEEMTTNGAPDLIITFTYKGR
jgi:hypothetical protein